MLIAHKQFDLYNKRVFEKAVFKPPLRMFARMSEAACFYYTIKGDANVYASESKVKLEQNEGVLLKCGTYLNEYVAAKDTEYCEAFAVHFEPDVLRMVYDKEFPGFLKTVSKIQPTSYQKVKSTQLLRSYIESLQFYFENPELVSEELLKLKLKELILLLAKTDDAEKITALLTDLFSKNEINFKATIEANLFNSLSIEELAYLTNLSLSSFKREFKKQYDTSPAKYIKQRRLGKAAELLKATKLRISDVAFDCGFGDLAHFSRSFQKYFSLSPSDYRASNKLN